jgi:hypothetical protein
MVRIATHNSGTGEKSKNFIHRLFEPFAKTQTKTIGEQIKSGVRYFDLRIDRNYIICHGLWKSNKNLFEVLSELEYYAIKKDTIIYYTLTVERNFKDIDTFINYLKDIRFHYSSIECVYIARKKPKWKAIYTFFKIPIKIDYISVPSLKEYKTFSFNNWRRYIPIPKILNRLYTRKHKFNEHYFTMIDFI